MGAALCMSTSDRTDTSLRVVCSAWCVVSAPLVLGMDLTDTAKLEPVIPIITNKVKKLSPFTIFRHFDVKFLRAGGPGCQPGLGRAPCAVLSFLLSFPCALLSSSDPQQPHALAGHAGEAVDPNLAQPSRRGTAVRRRGGLQGW